MLQCNTAALQQCSSKTACSATLQLCKSVRVPAKTVQQRNSTTACSSTVQVCSSLCCNRATLQLCNIWCRNRASSSAVCSTATHSITSLRPLLQCCNATTLSAFSTTMLDLLLFVLQPCIQHCSSLPSTAALLSLCPVPCCAHCTALTSSHMALLSSHIAGMSSHSTASMSARHHGVILHRWVTHAVLTSSYVAAKQACTALMSLHTGDVVPHCYSVTSHRCDVTSHRRYHSYHSVVTTP